MSLNHDLKVLVRAYGIDEVQIELNKIRAGNWDVKEISTGVYEFMPEEER